MIRRSSEFCLSVLHFGGGWPCVLGVLTYLIALMSPKNKRKHAFAFYKSVLLFWTHIG